MWLTLYSEVYVTAVGFTELFDFSVAIAIVTGLPELFAFFADGCSRFKLGRILTSMIQIRLRVRLFAVILESDTLCCTILLLTSCNHFLAGYRRLSVVEDVCFGSCVIELQSLEPRSIEFTAAKNTACRV